MADLFKPDSIELQIKQYSDALNAIFVADLQTVARGEFANLTAKQSVLLELLKHRPLTVTELANSLSITPSAVSQLIGKLEKSSYIERTINPGNRREIIVSLGQRGLDYHRMIEGIERAIIQKYYMKLERQDLESLLDIYKKLYAIAAEAAWSKQP